MVNSPNGGWVRALQSTSARSPRRCQCEDYARGRSLTSVLTGLVPLALVIAPAVVGDPSGTGRTSRRSRGRAAWPSWAAGCWAWAAVTAALLYLSGALWRFEHNIAGLGILATGGPVDHSACRWLTRIATPEMPG